METPNGLVYDISSLIGLIASTTTASYKVSICTSAIAKYVSPCYEEKKRERKEEEEKMVMEREEERREEDCSHLFLNHCLLVLLCLGPFFSSSPDIPS